MCHLKIDIHGDGVVTAVTSGDLPFEVAGQFFATTLMMEMFNRDNAGTAEFPGDFRNGYIDFGWDKQSDEWKKKKRTIELNNGRAAQMGLIGLMFHDALGNVADNTRSNRLSPPSENVSKVEGV